MILEFAGIHADGGIEVGHRAARVRRIKMVGALRRYQPVAVHDEFVPFCLAAEDGMVFQHQALRPRRVLLAVQRGCQAAEAAADNHEVEDLARILSVVGRIGEDMVTDLMTGRHHLEGVAVRFGIIADAAVTRPVVLAHLGQ